MFDILSLLTIKSAFKAMLTTDLLIALLSYSSDKPAYVMEVIHVILNLVREQDYDQSPCHTFNPTDPQHPPSTLSTFELLDLSSLLSSSHLRTTPCTALTDLPLLAEHGTAATNDLRRRLVLECQLLYWIKGLRECLRGEGGTRGKRMVSEVSRWLASEGGVLVLGERMVQEGVICEMLAIRRWVVDQTSKDYKGAIQTEINVT